MNSNLNNVVDKVKHIKPKSLIFPALFGLYVIILVIIFTGSAKELAQEINKVFTDIPRDNMYAVDVEKYALVAKKIGLPSYEEQTQNQAQVQEIQNTASTTPNAQTETQATSTQSISEPTQKPNEDQPESEIDTHEEQEESTSEQDPETPTPHNPELNLAELTVAVYNASGVTGLAGNLKTKLETAGFTVVDVGNADTQSQTTLSIKDSKKVFLPDLTSELLEYTLTTKTLPEDSDIDAVITIGENL